MSSPSTTRTTSKSTGGCVKVAANVSKLRTGFRIPIANNNKPKSNQFTDDEWAVVFDLMKTKPIPEIAEMDGIRISASRMYDIRREKNLPCIAAPRKSSYDGRMEKINGKKMDANLMRGWRR